MDNPRLRELWESLSADKGIPATVEERQTLALALLNHCRKSYEEARKNGDDEFALKTIPHSNLLWALHAGDCASWILDAWAPDGTPSLTDDNEWIGRERILLSFLLDSATIGIPPSHIGGFDYVNLQLPRWLFSMLKNALAALEQGETLPLVAPVRRRRHQAPWTWDQMRARALEWVHFLHGEGSRLEFALRRVGAAIGSAPDTIRKWKDELSGRESGSDRPIERRIATADAAGRYSFDLQCDPSFAKNDGNSIDAHAFALFSEMQDEPLEVFGRRYKELFGGRHWGDNSE